MTAMTTKQIIRAGESFLPLTEMISRKIPVSTRSTFDEDVWFPDIPPPRGGWGRIDFRMISEPLRSRTKGLIWSIIATTRRKHRADVGSFLGVSANVLRMATWLEARGIYDFSDCDAEMAREHLADVARWLEERSEQLQDEPHLWDRGEQLGDQLRQATQGFIGDDEGSATPREQTSRLRGDAIRVRIRVDPDADGAVAEARRVAGLDGAPGGWTPGVLGVKCISFPHVGRRGSASRGAAAGVYDPWERLYRHAPDLERIGIAPMVEEPFAGQSRERFLKAWPALYRYAVSALPDPVFVLLMQGAERILSAPAEDVIALVERVTGMIAGGMTFFEALEACSDHPFSTLEGETTPWNVRFSEASTIKGRALAFHQLIRLVRDAANLELFGQAGVRPSEVIVADGGMAPHARPRSFQERHRTGDPSAQEQGLQLPVALTETLSHSGLSTGFHFHSKVVKGRRDWKPASWVVGGRVDGGPMPPGATAVIILERLFSPLRRFVEGGSSALQLSSGLESGGPIPDELRMKPIDSASLRTSIKANLPQIADFSSLPEKWQGIDLRPYRDGTVRIAPYQLRKAWAQAVFRMEPRLKSAIARQLKHVRLAVTERFYITDDPVLSRHLDGMGVRQSNQLFERLIGGEVKLAGSMAPLIDAEMEKVRARLRGLSGVSRQEAIAEAAALQQVKVFMFDDAYCFNGLRPRASVCNRFGRGAHWSRMKPDLAVRDRGLCSDCPCAAFSSDHAPALLRGYVADRRAWLEAEAAGLSDWHLISRARARRDAALLSRLGIRLPTDEEIMRDD